MPKKILLVEDDPKLAAMLIAYLGERDFVVDHAATLATANDLSARHTFDLVILDLTLPDGDGIDFCREFRSRYDSPILMLTARGDEMDRIVGLELGADDYMAKPFNPRELVARIRAILRRASSSRTQSSGARAFGSLVVDFDAMKVTRDGQEAVLTSFQFTLLKALIERAGRPVSRDQLMDMTRGEELEAFDRSVDVHISRIRAAIEENPKKPALIKTVRGVGYLFTGRPEEGGK